MLTAEVVGTLGAPLSLLLGVTNKPTGAGLADVLLTSFSLVFGAPNRPTDVVVTLDIPPVPT